MDAQIDAGRERRPIRALSTLVANQIAAGEVVERPASVVKELVENALDAGATRITVELEQGGIELVRITDDGVGIPEDELALAIAPHATSKISDAQDLDGIGTLGFRGEALASIASVSRLSLRSRTRQANEAAILEVEGGASRGTRPTAGPVGTCVTVRNLFFNTPARRKFLKTPGTEQERCVDALRAITLAHPAVGFTLLVDGRRTMDLPALQSPRQRTLEVIGGELSSQLLEVHADGFDDARGLALWGLVGLPSIARGSSKHQHVFVNGRAVRDKTIQHALNEAYRGLIEPGRYATAVLMIEMSPKAVDVNVHPAKAEVRFRDSSMVHSAVYRAVRDALRSKDLTPTAAALRPGASGAPGPQLDPALPGLATREGAAQEDAGTVARFVEFFQKQAPAAKGFSYADMRESLAEASPAPRPPAEAQLPQSRILQVHNSYLVTQDEQGVVIIDQHALHERVMFEYLLTRIGIAPLESQRLLAPGVVAADSATVRRLGELAPLLLRIGVEAEALGPSSVGVHAFPSFLFDRGVDPIEFVGELLAKFEQGLLDVRPDNAGLLREEALRDVLDMMSCKAAVKAGDHLSDLETGELLRLRDAVERSSNCPHGRPTSVRLSIRELEKLFGRA